MRRSRLPVTGGVVVMLVLLPVSAQQEPDALVQALGALAEASAPGEHHRHLKPMLGRWDTVMRLLGPDGRTVQTEGLTKVSLVLGGRFLKSEFKGRLLDRQFEGLGFDGYDSVAEQHVGVWMDTLGTSPDVYRGRCADDGKVVTTYAEIADPLTGASRGVKTVTTIQSDSEFTYERWVRDEEGEYTTKTLEATLKRRVERKTLRNDGSR